MAASNISITQGTGTRLATNSYTEGAVTVHDEKVILGEPYLPTYMAQPGAVATTATANSHMAQLMAGSSLNVYVRRVFIYQFALAGAATIVNVQLRRLTTAGTGGSAGLVNLYDTTDPAAGATTMTLPSSKGTEGVSFIDGTMGVLAAAPTAPSEGGVLIFDWDAERLRTKAIRIPAGTANGLCVKNVTALATATYLVNIMFTEASF